MPRKSLSHLECAVANTVEMVSDQWTVLILRDAFQGIRRFDQFVESLGIARNTLSSRLERLVSDGILFAEPYQEHPVRYEYRLTDKGKDLFDSLMVIWAYGERWSPPSNPDRQRAIHIDCGHEADAVAHCGHCGERITRRSIRIVPPNEVADELGVDLSA